MKRTLITNGKLLASSLVISMAFSSTAMAQAKSTSTTPQADLDESQQKKKISKVKEKDKLRGHVIRSNRSSGVTPDVGDAIKPANSYGSTRSNRGTSGAAPAGCVTEAGAVDSNCDGVDDASVKAEEGKTDILFRRPGRLEHRGTSGAAPAGCVTEAGAKDVNCDGVDDAPVKAEEGKTDILFRRPGRLE